MKKYNICFCYDAKVDVEVLANSREEAIEKASQIEMPLEDYDFDLNETIVNTTDEEIGSLDELTEKAVEIMKRVDCIGPISFLTASVLVWDGFSMNPIVKRIDSIYWDELHEEICFDAGDSSECCLSDCSEIEQYNICKEIIKSDKTNH